MTIRPLAAGRAFGTWFLMVALQIARWTVYPPVFASYAVALAVPLGMGSAVGLPELFWHERWPTQLLAGASLMALCAELAVVGCLLDSKTFQLPLLVRYPQFLAYARPPCLIFLALVLVGRRSDSALAGWAAPLGAAAVLGLIHLPIFTGALRALSRWLVAVSDRARAFGERHAPALVDLLLPEIPADQRAAAAGGAPVPVEERAAFGHALQGALALVIATIYGIAHLVPLPALLVVAVAVMIVNAIWGFLAYWTGPWRVLLFVATLGLMLWLGGSGDGQVPGLATAQVAQAVHAAPLLDGGAAVAAGSAAVADGGTAACDPALPATPVPSGQPVAPLLDEARVLDAWRTSTGAGPPVLVVVATSGGASRAAAWTVTVLTELERHLPRFHRHIRIITGASGGMVGASHYVARLGPGGMDPTREKEVLLDRVARDFLTPLARALLLVGAERGAALQRAWEQASPELARPMGDLRGGEAQGWRPSLVFAPMLVEDGRRLLASNLDLKPLTEAMGPLLDPQDKCHLRPDNCRMAIGSLQLFELFRGGAAQIPLSAVARMSATFPYVTASVALPTEPGRRVVDAGYYDNYGVNVAALWIRHHARWLVAHTGGVLLLQIRDERLSEVRNRFTTPPGPGAVGRVLSPLTAPIQAMLNARESTMSFRNDELVQTLAADHHFAARPGFFRTAVFELPGEEPLNWYLTPATRRRIGGSMGTGSADDPGTRAADPCTYEWNRVSLARLCAWWQAHNRPAPGAAAPRCFPEPARRCQ